ncbi:MAG TPA: AzlD domain-containing protein [Ktedonobacteraceae bacterium]|jgi:branched-subunit amino acid transport protein|nr:AzlD domain-containing protein [Ktedonobacteraceae bacterium]
MMLWLMIICIGIITYGMRLSFIMFFGNREMPSRLLHILRFVPMAVLSAIILPQLVLPGSAIDLSLQNPRWIAGSFAAIVAWRTRNVLLTIAVGMVALWILQMFLR